VAILPSQFKFLEYALTQSQSMSAPRAIMASDTEPRASVLLDRELGEALVAWGRQIRNDATIIAGVNIHPIYESQDIEGSELVEICLPYYLDASRVLNPKAALKVVWACNYCDRVQAQQTANLSVERTDNFAAHLTYNNEWIVPSSYTQLLKQFGLQTRPLENTKDSVQVLIDQSVSIDESYPPIIPYGNPCPGCGLRSLRRNRGVEGNPLDPTFPGMVIYTDTPVTIKALDVSELVFARSVERLHNPRISNVPLHNAGDLIDYHHISLHYYDASPIFVAKTALVHKLLESGATGLAFRPLNIATAPTT